MAATSNLLLLASVSGFALLSVGPANAADEATTSGATSSALQVEEIVVTARRRDEKLSQTPVAITALTPESLTKQSITTESDLQLAIPGLLTKATQDANQLNFSMRGQSVDANTGSQPAVQPYINEVPITSAVASGFYDLQSIQALKGPQGTLFGRNVTGGAVLYTTGRPTDEFGGYVQLQTGDYDRRNAQGALNLPLGERAAFRLAANYEHRDGFTHNRFDDSTAGDLRRSGARGSLLLKPTDSIENLTVYEYSRIRGSATPSVIYSLYDVGSSNNGSALASNAAALYSPLLDVITAFPGAYAAYVAAHPGTDPNGIGSFFATQSERGAYDVTLDHELYTRGHGHFVSNATTIELTDALQLRNIFGFYKNRSSQAIDLDGTPYNAESDYFVFRNRQYSEELQLLGNLTDNLDLTLAAFYSQSSQHTDTDVVFFDVSPIIPGANPVFFTKIKYRTLAGYGQATYDLAHATGIEGLSITAGLRYTRERVTEEQLPGSALHDLPGLPNSVTQNENRLSYNFGPQLQVTPDLLFYATTRRSFRSGGFNIYAPQLPGTASEGGNAFDPEIVHDVELGAKYAGNIGMVPVRANLALYKMWIKDVQRALFADVPGVGISGFTANIPKASVKGIELDGSVTPFGSLTVGGSLAYTDAKFTDNEATVFGQASTYSPYGDTPEWSGSAYVDLSFPLANDLGALELRADVFSQSHFFFGSLADTTVPGTRIDGYTIANFRAGIDNIAGSRFSVTGYLRNAFDKEYFVGGLPTGGVLGLNTAVPGEPRTWFVELRTTF